jgi:hypothetical protein
MIPVRWLLSLATVEMSDTERDPPADGMDEWKDEANLSRPEKGKAANSALTGRVDYVDLAERVTQGVTVDDVYRGGAGRHSGRSRRGRS